MQRTAIIDALVATGHYDRTLVSQVADDRLQDFYNREVNAGTISRSDARTSRTDGGQDLEAIVIARVAAILNARDGSSASYGGGSGGGSGGTLNLDGEPEFEALCRRFDASHEYLEDFAAADPWKVGARSAHTAAAQALNLKIGGR